MSAETTCMWSLNTDDEFGMYETSCKQAFVFTEGSPKDNDFRFCRYCGKPLEMNHYVEVFQQADLDAARVRGEQMAAELAKAVERGNADGVEGTPK